MKAAVSSASPSASELSEWSAGAIRHDSNSPRTCSPRTRADGRGRAQRTASGFWSVISLLRSQSEIGTSAVRGLAERRDLGEKAGQRMPEAVSLFLTVAVYPRWDSGRKSGSRSRGNRSRAKVSPPLPSKLTVQMRPHGPIFMPTLCGRIFYVSQRPGATCGELCPGEQKELVPQPQRTQHLMHAHASASSMRSTYPSAWTSSTSTGCTSSSASRHRRSDSTPASSCCTVRSPSRPFVRSCTFAADGGLRIGSLDSAC